MGPGLDNCVMVTYGSVIRGNRVKHIGRTLQTFHFSVSPSASLSV